MGAFKPHDEEELKAFRRKVLDLLEGKELPKHELARLTGYDNKKIGERLKHMVYHGLLSARLTNERHNGTKIYYFSKFNKDFEPDIEFMNRYLFGVNKPYKVNPKYSKMYQLENERHTQSGQSCTGQVAARSYYGNMAIFPKVEY